MMPESAPYCGPAPLPQGLWAAWNTDWRLWLVLLMLLIPAWGVARRGYFLTAWGLLVVAFVSPLCALTVALFSARTAHHLLLLCAVAPLLAVCMPRRGGQLSAALIGILLSGVMVLWHLSAVYTALWNNHALYLGMQILLLSSATLFWANIFELSAQNRTVTALASLAALTMVMGMIGAVLTFSPRLLYPQHMASTWAYGLSPLADQQLSGLLMWVPGFLPFATACGLIAKRLFASAASEGELA